MTDHEPGISRTLAQKIDHLFKTVHPKDRGEFTHREVAQAIEQQGGPTVSATYIWQLRKGARDNPTRAHIEALSKFFHVPVTYFFNDEEAAEIDQELAALKILRDSGVRRVAFRSSDLSPGGIEAIARMIEHVRAVEGLPTEGAEHPRPGSDTR